MAQLDWYMRANLKPRHLQMLVSLDDYRNIGKVAASLNVTQPAVSKALGELERGLGLGLFERGARGVNPTAYGECLIRHARTVLRNLAQARDELRDLMQGASGKVAVGALPAAAPALLPRAVAGLKAHSPGTTVFIREGTMDVLLAELRMAPMSGIEPSMMPTRVMRSRGGRKRRRSGAVGFFAPGAPRDASHVGDSGKKKSTATPRIAGAAARWKSQRHSSTVTDQIWATCESRRMPVLIAAPIKPATVGRALSGHDSATSATAFGHTPPTHSPTRKRRTSICSCVVTQAPRPAKME